VPCFRRIKFNHKAVASLILRLVDGVLIAVEACHASVYPDALFKQRIHNGIRV